MKILLLNDTRNWYHFGCTATSFALIKGIQDLGHQVTAIPINMLQAASVPTTAIDFISDNTLSTFTKNNPSIIRLIHTHDAVIINGEGTLHGLAQLPCTLLYIAYIAKTTYNKHVEILNHSAYPENSDIINCHSDHAFIYKTVYDHLDYAAIREASSMSVMQQLTDNISESFDCLPLYIKHYYTQQPVTRTKNLVLLAGSAYWGQFSQTTNFDDIIEGCMPGFSAINQCLGQLENNNYQIKFLCGANAFPAQDDMTFLNIMKQEFHREIAIYTAHSVTDWLNTIASASLLISGRFHHTLAALCLNTPFISFNSNTPKIAGLLTALHSDSAPLKYSDKNILNTVSCKLEQFFAKKLLLDDKLLQEQLYKKANKNFTHLGGSVAI
ncbi:polysaccharide pyruvyl transferase family protein [Piscirickettsia salmonis]|uniref:polysaccharide pyruvyl transferase family protein n=1 Tax=Piscirickettsia salmonis TaxID=1238 RepID=UPI0007C8C305|nr:Polysaccharide pyruvyl transferase [Piscirickettsiaceae bacterium NZ-RLO1]